MVRVWGWGPRVLPQGVAIDAPSGPPPAGTRPPAAPLRGRRAGGGGHGWTQMRPSDRTEELARRIAARARIHPVRERVQHAARRRSVCEFWWLPILRPLAPALRPALPHCPRLPAARSVGRSSGRWGRQIGGTALLRDRGRVHQNHTMVVVEVVDPCGPSPGISHRWG